MSLYQCPKGHDSTEPDYCSECGTKIQGISQVQVPINVGTLTVSTSAKNVMTCPDCTAPHELDSGYFCEICGYNFVTGSHGDIPTVTPTSNVSEIPTGTPSNLPFFEIIATIDPSLKTPESPDPPKDQSPLIFSLDHEMNLIGRTSDRRGIFPQISLDVDDAISHRHALIIRQNDGTLLLRDVGSSNGTSLNGVDLPSMVDKPLKDGDKITLGHWTVLTVKMK